MSTHNLHFQDKIGDLELFHILISAVMENFRELKNEFELAVVNEPSVFEPSQVKRTMQISIRIIYK